MTEQALQLNGFKKKKSGSEYWFELNIRNHKFVTNDNLYNNNKDKWHIGYQNTKEMEELFWFNCKLIFDVEFKTMFRILTGIEFKLAHQRKLI